jgi:uncharacterized protein YoaH (UPF0181 family)
MATMADLTQLTHIWMQQQEQISKNQAEQIQQLMAASIPLPSDAIKKGLDEKHFRRVDKFDGKENEWKYCIST